MTNRFSMPACMTSDTTASVRPIEGNGCGASLWRLASIAIAGLEKGKRFHDPRGSVGGC